MELENAHWRQIEEAQQEDSTWHTQTEERLARLETLVYLSRLISSSLEMTQVLTAICQATATLLHVPYVTIWRADEAARMLVAPACSDVEMVHSLPRTSIGFGQGTLGWVAQYRQPLNIPDVFADGRVLDLDWWQMRHFRSRFATPILHQETLLGVLGMMGPEPFDFSPDDLWLLQQLLAQATVAIRSATLYQKAQRAEEYYRFITEQQTDLICRFRPDTTLTFVNEAYCRYFGKTRAELIGRSFLTLLPPQARAAAQDHIVSLIAQPRNVTYEHEVSLSQGGIAWQQWVDHAIVDAQGQVQEFLSVGRDITDRKRIEDALRTSEAFTRAILASLPAYIVVLDKDGTILAVNEAWQRFDSVSSAHPPTCLGIGMNYLEVCRQAVTASEVYARQTLDGIQAVLDRTRESFELEYPCFPPERQRWFMITVTPLQGRHGAVVLHTEITQQKQTEAALRRSEAALRAHQAELQLLASKLIWAQEEERRRLARELHDDLSQRLAFLAIETGKWEKMSDAVPPTVRDELHMIHEQLVTLATDVHALSHQLHSSMLEDLGLVDALRTECATVMQREGVTVSFEAVDVPTTLSREVTLCLYRILQEGLRNVVKHAHAKHVEVMLRKIDDHLEITIHDTGVGFVPEQTRGKAGLGLASMAERVRLVQGTFTLASQPGHGTTIGVRVPLDKGEG